MLDIGMPTASYWEVLDNILTSPVRIAYIHMQYSTYRWVISNIQSFDVADEELGINIEESTRSPSSQYEDGSITPCSAQATEGTSEVA
jgi:hypothetical protein